MPGEREFTIDLRGRAASRPTLTYDEAEAMRRLGFRFSIFEPGQNEFALSIPYATAWNIDRGRLTFRQAG
ncbi:MAG TPA: hypothetical protein VFT69_16980 [Pseudolabrys sp.]|nr:hypothetical protein [Pseudolabrys sp.]